MAHYPLPGVEPGKLTTRQRFEEILYNRGIFEGPAKQIMDYAIPLIDAEMAASEGKEGAPGYKITWDRPASEYPDAMYAALMITHIPKHVYQWGLDNQPQAFWLPMFAPKA